MVRAAKSNEITAIPLLLERLALTGGLVTIDGLTRRLAACFTDTRRPDLIEHEVETLVMQRVVGIALGYEDLNDHDQLRHDPVMQRSPASAPPGQGIA